MNVWKLVSAGVLEHMETENPAREEKKVRVRVTKVLVNGTDNAIFNGDLKVKYPLIPGRYAVGMVAEDGVPHLPKGTRLLLHSVIDAPDTGTKPKDFSEDEFLLCGRTTDGYLRDLISIPSDQFTVLPDSLHDENALLMHHVALAKAAADKLGAVKGQHIAVIGANLLGILLCQLLIYQQAAPILIDAQPERLEFARSCGIYYTIASDADILKKVAGITGGRLVSGAAYITTALRNDVNTAFSLCAQNANVVLCGFGDGIQLSATVPFRKQLAFYCVSHRSDNLEAAINLAVRGAVDVSAFRFRSVKAEDTAGLLEVYRSTPEKKLGEINLVSLY